MINNAVTNIHREIIACSLEVSVSHKIKCKVDLKKNKKFCIARCYIYVPVITITLLLLILFWHIDHTKEKEKMKVHLLSNPFNGTEQMISQDLLGSHKICRDVTIYTVHILNNLKQILKVLVKCHILNCHL